MAGMGNASQLTAEQRARVLIDRRLLMAGWAVQDGGPGEPGLADRVDPRFEIAPGDVLVSRANTTAYVGAPVLVRATPQRRLLSDKSLRLAPRSDVNREWLVTELSAPSPPADLRGGDRDERLDAQRLAEEPPRRPGSVGPRGRAGGDRPPSHGGSGGCSAAVRGVASRP
ncbi:hypothetical protein E4P41_18885 [Geodermatophilus sp. DF01-2]|nr:hypothetical protein E4P41_18885 [Geodermatophilus sp. DF01_2]